MTRQVACIGTGVIGMSWAITFARAGFEVRLHDTEAGRAQRALVQIRNSLTDMRKVGIVQDLDSVLGRISIDHDLASAAGNAVYVQESIIETTEAKRKLFDALGALAPEDAILASSTSGIPGSAFMLTTRNPGRCIVAHPVNPPHLIPCVELCGTEKTSADTLARARAFLLAVGQKPIVLRKEIDGFILNRIQLAVIGEALHLVGEGYCSASDIDWAMKYGLGLRWAFLGVFETGHLNHDAGYREYVMKFESLTRPLLAALRVNYAWDEVLINSISNEMMRQIPRECIGDAQAWRNRRLMALRQHLDTSEPPPQVATKGEAGSACLNDHGS